MTIRHRFDLLETPEYQGIRAYIVNRNIGKSDFVLSIVSCILLLSLRILICGANNKLLFNVMTPIKRLCRPFGKRPGSEIKMAEMLWYFAWHFFSFLFGTYVLLSEFEFGTAHKPGWVQYIFRTNEFIYYIVPTPSEPVSLNPGWPLFPMGDQMRHYYFIEIGYWLSCLIILNFETIRKDYIILLLHHITTLSLLIISCSLSFFRIGIIVLWIHDILDIFLHIMKCFLYSKYAERFPTFCNFMLYSLTLIMFISRLMIYPYFCIYSIPIIRTYTNAAGYHLWIIPGSVICSCLLLFLQFIHIIWFIMIMRMVFRTKVQNVNDMGDVRSDDEATSENEQPYNTTSDHEEKSKLTKRRKKHSIS
ncbi:longevity-assurance protein, putative [Cryptosporidium muris RN66]|uniref:Longevity-assurance protein, putative n=1 Tax=Cryptosporidium muris (strain RN66) TaxID=441375 RepID=B6ACW1_CRYMR|nr:longevity-assurance protein, putative [Cryptosporidium muris RN66]EEA05965.1 longevity-assurance protein, putative [Cryptosporidium muris RN66]|eukprot:XP_002140314.1 longevity-assurance protein [Cryptosporidium muris RN66]